MTGLAGAAGLIYKTFLSPGVYKPAMRVVLAFAINTFFNFIIGLMVAKFLGPEEYGRFALALALGIVVQTALFDWLKLAATRFYSERARHASPQLRATLDLSFAVLAVLVTLAAAAFLLSGLEVQLSGDLIALGFAAAIANGLFDYNTAMVRARFMDQHYARLVIVKNLAAFALTGGGAFVFGSAKMALVGVCLALAGSVVSVRGALLDPQSPVRFASLGAAKMAVAYAFPVISANVLYQLIPLFTRALIAQRYGFAESGQFSLAYDIGVRIVAAIGSTLDVLLFQIAVAADEAHGPASARRQIARNMLIVLAIIAPACLGLWFTLPSIEQIVVPEKFRGPFSAYLSLLLPGLFCYAVLFYGLNPVFQISRRTNPVIFSALIAATADVLLILALPQGNDASLIVLAQGAMFIMGLAALAGFAVAVKADWPTLKDAAAIVAGTAAMFAALWQLRGLPPGAGALALQILSGAGVYAAAGILLNIANFRNMLITYYKDAHQKQK